MGYEWRIDLIDLGHLTIRVRQNSHRLGYIKASV